MKFFTVLVNGRNFLIETEDGTENLGFYVQVYVKAETEAEAEVKAIEVLRGDENIRSIVKNDKSNPPRMFVEDFLAFDKPPKTHKGKMVRTGMAWYPDGDDENRTQSREVFNQ